MVKVWTTKEVRSFFRLRCGSIDCAGPGFFKLFGLCYTRGVQSFFMLPPHFELTRDHVRRGNHQSKTGAWDA